MQYRFVIKGKLPGLNEYLKADRSFRKGHSCGNDMKQRGQAAVAEAIRKDLRHTVVKAPVTIHYAFYEPDRRRDLDNIAAVAHKFIQDALVSSGVIENDGWRHIKGFSDEFHVDRHSPRIEVTLTEAGGGDG